MGYGYGEMEMGLLWQTDNIKGCDMGIKFVIELAVLFALKAVDNLLSTGKAILIQRHRPILASLSVVLSQVIFYKLIS